MSIPSKGSLCHESWWIGWSFWLRRGSRSSVFHGPGMTWVFFQKLYKGISYGIVLWKVSPVTNVLRCVGTRATDASRHPHLPACFWTTAKTSSEAWPQSEVDSCCVHWWSKRCQVKSNIRVFDTSVIMFSGVLHAVSWSTSVLFHEVHQYFHDLPCTSPNKYGKTMTQHDQTLSGGPGSSRDICASRPSAFAGPASDRARFTPSAFFRAFVGVHQL